MLGLGTKELEAAPKLGKTVSCPRCGEEHEVLCSSKGRRADGSEGDTDLQFYHCPEMEGSTYLCGINGKSVMKNFRSTSK